MVLTTWRQGLQLVRKLWKRVWMTQNVQSVSIWHLKPTSLVSLWYQGSVVNRWCPPIVFVLSVGHFTAIFKDKMYWFSRIKVIHCAHSELVRSLAGTLGWPFNSKGFKREHQMAGGNPGCTFKNSLHLLSLTERGLKIQQAKGQGERVLSVEIIKHGAGRGLERSTCPAPASGLDQLCLKPSWHMFS